MSDTLLVIHGGAGEYPATAREKHKEYVEGLRGALDTGYAILEKGGSSLEATTAAVEYMEDYPLFNAGKGAVFNSDGVVQLDAAVMDGKTRDIGSIAGVRRVRNPIRLARAVLEHSKHVLFVAEGAERFAESRGLELVDPRYFFTDFRWQQLQRVKKKGGVQLDHSGGGTVGAVALDQAGNLAAATSTGGMGNQLPGRVGDTPIIGAGTYADNRTCAVSATGMGERFIRAVAAHRLSALMEYGSLSIQEASRRVMQEVGEHSGGLVAVDSKGDFAMPYNTGVMFRGVVGSKVEKEIGIEQGGIKG